jgi:hypothetical protein
MSVLKPTEEDIRKINNEINQIVNQRYLITTAAITIFGLFASMLIPKDRPIPNTDIGGLVLFGTILLLTLLLVLFLYSHFLRGILRTMTCYLIETNSSNWEIDWKKYRKKRYFGYSSAQTIIFIMLGIISFLYPIGLSIVFKQNLAPRIGLLFLVIAGSIYIVVIILVGFFNLLCFEKKSEKKWKKI